MAEFADDYMLTFIHPEYIVLFLTIFAKWSEWLYGRKR